MPLLDRTPMFLSFGQSRAKRRHVLQILFIKVFDADHPVACVVSGCHVSEKQKTGPATAPTIAVATDTKNANGEPAQRVTALATWSKAESRPDRRPNAADRD